MSETCREDLNRVDDAPPVWLTYVDRQLSARSGDQVATGLVPMLRLRTAAPSRKADTPFGRNPAGIPAYDVFPEKALPVAA